MMFFQPFPDVGTFPGEGAAVARGLFLFGAGGADLPVAAVDAGYQGGVALEAPEVSADKAQPHGSVADGVYGGAIHGVRVAAVGTAGNRCAPKVLVGITVLFNSKQKSVPYVIGEKLPHPQKSTRYCLTHGLKLLLREFGVDYRSYCIINGTRTK